jgi:hypothetical protein
MNQRAEIILELVYNNNTFRMNIPMGSAYDDAKAAAEAFCNQIDVMRQNALAMQQAQKQEGSSTAATS